MIGGDIILVSDWSRRLLGVISLSLGQERGHLDTLHTGMVTSGEADTEDNCTTLRYRTYGKICFPNIQSGPLKV